MFEHDLCCSHNGLNNLRIPSCKVDLQRSIAEAGDLIFATQNRQHETQIDRPIVVPVANAQTG